MVWGPWFCFTNVDIVRRVIHATIGQELVWITAGISGNPKISDIKVAAAGVLAEGATIEEDSTIIIEEAQGSVHA